ncbi:MAG: OOP family OmpA-OmpF porin [Alteromonadaceae bacterium]|jgi:OOP family OmpA-OmpF porin
MNKSTIALLTALISSPLAAQDLDNNWQMAVFADYLKGNSNKDDLASWQYIDSGKSLGIEVRKALSEHWQFRFEYAVSEYDINHGNDDQNAKRYGIDAMYKIADTNFYSFIGYKRFDNVKAYDTVNVGLGYNYAINDKFSLFTEAAIYQDLNYGYTDQGIKLGFNYLFGSSPRKIKNSAKVSNTSLSNSVAPSPVIPKQLDDDNDGINNVNDMCLTTPMTHKVDVNGCSIYKDVVSNATFLVQFSNNSHKIEDSFNAEIEKLANMMKQYPNSVATLAGYSSSAGEAEYNLALSQQRADALKSTLMSKFTIQSERLVSNAYGENSLLSQDYPMKNRRVEVNLEITKKEAVTK